jgi:hypothetical protein
MSESARKTIKKSEVVAMFESGMKSKEIKEALGLTGKEMTEMKAAFGLKHARPKGENGARRERKPKEPINFIDDVVDETSSTVNSDTVESVISESSPVDMPTEQMFMDF